MAHTAQSDYNNIINRLVSLAEGKPRFMLAIDGRCCSGKTTFANLLADKTDAVVLRSDDFYLPFDLRPEGCLAKPAGHMDIERFKREVLLPASKGAVVKYKPFDCKNNKFSKEEVITPSRFIIVEGSYCQHPKLAAAYDYKLFFTADCHVQANRLIKRNGKEVSDLFNKTWLPAEEIYFKIFNIQNSSDVVIDTSHIW